MSAVIRVRYDCYSLPGKKRKEKKIFSIQQVFQVFQYVVSYFPWVHVKGKKKIVSEKLKTTTALWSARAIADAFFVSHNPNELDACMVLI